MTRIYLGLGANLGRPREQLARAVAALAGTPGIAFAGVSSLYRTRPIGGPRQPDYLNAVLALDTGWRPGALLARGLALESQAGRLRSGKRGEPRPLDIDLLLYGRERIDAPNLRLPHPRMRTRAFVLAPLAELAPDLWLPPNGPTARGAARAMGREGVVRLSGGDGWWIPSER